MFSKLLKHDSRAILKYWWIGAVVSLGISALGGICMQINSVEYTKLKLLSSLAAVGSFFAIVGIVLLPLFTEILLLVRYYKNFFTDEGYLTFTLPVRKTSLLDSKIVSALIFSFASTFLVALDVSLMLAIGIPEDFLNPQTWREIFEIIGELLGVLGGYAIGYIIIGILIILVSTILQALFIFACITFASSLVKKHKVLMTIGIYYGTNIAVSILMNILSIGGLPTVFTLIFRLDESNFIGAIMFVLLGVLGILTLVTGALYLFVLYLLDRRLNLE